jgi:hypothetical protein
VIYWPVSSMCCLGLIGCVRKDKVGWLFTRLLGYALRGLVTLFIGNLTTLCQLRK